MAAELRPTHDKRQAILEAALALFAERGFHGTTMPSVAEAACVGAGTLYRYFEGKEALVNAVYQHWKGELAKSLLVEFPVEAPPRSQFGEMWRRLGQFALDHPNAFVFLELHHHAVYLDAKSREADARVLLPLHEVVRAAIHAQVLKDRSPELLMAIVWGALVAILRAHQAGHIVRDDLSRTLDDAEECLWEAIRR